MAKKRLDQVLVERRLAETRSRAQALIMAGEVDVDGRRADKAGAQIAPDQRVALRNQGRKWVSRGAFKLLHGLVHFDIDVTGKTTIDVGASTGGFTEVLLEYGARHVFSVDVGHGQLDWGLRNDPRVTVLERTNARYLDREQIPEPIDLVVCDASFISLKKVLPAALRLCREPARCCCLIKPQFEAGREQVGKGGVVRDPDVHKQVCDDIRNWLDAFEQWQAIGITPSPITGPQGNKEFLIGGRKTADS